MFDSIRKCSGADLNDTDLALELIHRSPVDIEGAPFWV